MTLTEDIHFIKPNLSLNLHERERETNDEIDIENQDRVLSNILFLSLSENQKNEMKT